MADGSFGAGTAALEAPYDDHPESAGLLLHPEAELREMIRAADAAGFQLAVHAIGDRASRLVLDAYESAARVHGPRDRRFRIEHAQMVSRPDLSRYRALGVIASVQPSHAIDDLRFAEARVGRERARLCYNVRSFLQAGIPSVDIIDLEYEPWHTARDTLDAVSARSLQVVGDVVLAALPQIEARITSRREAPPSRAR